VRGTVIDMTHEGADADIDRLAKKYWASTSTRCAPRVRCA